MRTIHTFNKMKQDMTKEELLSDSYKQQAVIENLITDNQKLQTEKEQVEQLFKVLIPLAQELKKMNWMQRLFKAASLGIQIANYILNYKQDSNGKA